MEASKTPNSEEKVTLVAEAAGFKDLDASAKTHDEQIEQWVIWSLGVVVAASFVFHFVYLYAPTRDNKEGVNFASSAGQTALGALVAVVARRNKNS